MSLVEPSDDAGWTPERHELHSLLTERSEVLASYYASAIYYFHTQAAPARMSHLGHAIRELCMHLPDAMKTTKFDRSDTDAKVSALVEAWEKTGVPDEPDDFPLCPSEKDADAGGRPVAALHRIGGLLLVA